MRFSLKARKQKTKIAVTRLTTTLMELWHQSRTFYNHVVFLSLPQAACDLIAGIFGSR
jgi:hypothetical protein